MEKNTKEYHTNNILWNGHTYPVREIHVENEVFRISVESLRDELLNGSRNGVYETIETIEEMDGYCTEEELVSLSDYELYTMYFKKGTEINKKAHTFDFDGVAVSVTDEEVRNFYPKEYRLTTEDIEQFAAKCTAERKHLRNCKRMFDGVSVKKLLAEEHLMKNGERIGLLLKLYFLWHVEIYKDDCSLYPPYKYAVTGKCLDCISSFQRRYTSLEDALLHCANGFNENANIPDKYKSIDDFLKSNK